MQKIKIGDLLRNKFNGRKFKVVDVANDVPVLENGVMVTSWQNWEFDSRPKKSVSHKKGKKYASKRKSRKTGSSESTKSTTKVSIPDETSNV